MTTKTTSNYFSTFVYLSRRLKTGDSSEYLGLDKFAVKRLFCVKNSDVIELNSCIPKWFEEQPGFNYVDWCDKAIKDIYRQIYKKTFSRSKDMTFLKLLEVTEYCFQLPTYKVLRILQRFLMTDSHLDRKILKRIKKIFFLATELKDSVFDYNGVSIQLVSRVKSVQDAKEEKSLLFITDSKTFRLLSYFGFKSAYTKKQFGYLRKLISSSNKKSDEELMQAIDELKIPNTTKFRVLQVVSWWITEKERERPSADLRTLWDSISDRFLCEKDFTLPPSVVPLYPESYQLLLDIYNWYKISVRQELSAKTPRSLLHLSRCKIRDILSENFRLPEGILQFSVGKSSHGKNFNIPSSLKKYLLLENEFWRRENSISFWSDEVR